MKTIIPIIVLLASIFSSCKSFKKKDVYAINLKTFSVSAYNNPMDIYREAAPMLWNIVNTRVALSFDYEHKTANGEEWVILQPYFYATDTLELDAKAMKIEKVTIGYQDKVLPYTYDSSKLHIVLDRKYTKEEQIKLHIKYVAMPYSMATGGSSAITDDRGLYFVNTDKKIPGKPVQIWTQGETESNSHWLPTIDKPNSRTPIQLELTVSMEYKTLSNGVLISSMEKGYERVDIWKINDPIQVYAIMFAIGDFAIVKDKWKDKEVNYYVEPAYADYAQKMFQYTPEMIQFFSDVTGVHYPWNKYSQVVVRDYVSGAMENTSASLFGEFMNQNNREYADENYEDVVSHELFHQWFGDYVTAESWSNLTVNESFATYGEYLWRKHKYGIDYAKELAYSDLQKYLNYAVFSDPKLVRHHYADKEAMFDRISYQKGGAVLHYLHQIIGDTAFYKSMNIYLSKNALKPAEATHWRLAVEEATGKDMNWFFDQWYHRAGHPILDIKYSQDEVAQKLKVKITQIQEGEAYQLPLDVLVLNGEEKKLIRWNLSHKTDTFTYDYIKGIAPLIVPDAAHVLPGIIKENKSHKDYWLQMNTCPDYNCQLIALNSVASAGVLKNEETKMILSNALDNKLSAIRLAALQKINIGKNEPLRDFFKKSVIAKATLDGNNKVRATAFEIFGKWKLKEQKQLLMDAIRDSSYLVAGSALYSLYEIDDSLGYTFAKKYLHEKPNTLIDKKAWSIIADKANAADTNLFVLAMENNFGAESRNHLSENLLVFANQSESINSFATVLELFAEKVKLQENKNQRQSDAEMLVSLNTVLNNQLKKNKKNNLLIQKLDKIKSIAQMLNTKEQETEIKNIYNSITQ